MHRHPVARIASLAALVAAGTLATAQNIGVLLGRSGHNSEFDSAFEKLGWEPTRFACSPEGMKDFTASINKLDLVLVVPLFNYSKDGWILSKEATDYKAIKKYLENGGMLVVTDGSYGQPRGWLEAIDPAFGGLSTGKCTSSQWGVLGHTTNEKPVHPIRCFPNAITEGDSWPHFEDLPKGSKWKVLARCSEGKPVVLYQEVGKGTVVLTCLRQPGETILENYYAFSQLRKAGLMVKSFSLTDLKPGPGHLEIELLSAPSAGSSVAYEITDAKNKTTSFSTNLTGTACAIDFHVTARGAVTAAVYLDTPTGRKLLFRRMKTLPQLLEMSPNAYRGILSTKRRTDEVDFKASFAPDWEDLTEATLTLRVYDALSNEVAMAEHILPTNNVSAEIWFPVPLSTSLAACGYRIDGHLKQGLGRKGFRASASTAFEILAPRVAQTVIDEDKTFLVNGKPFFPLGVYHIGPEDFPVAADIGFNTIQFWKWHVGDDGYGAPIGLNKAAGNRLKCLFESNHSGENIWKSCAEQYGDHPAMLMWYVADEPAEGNEAGMKLTNDTWHQYDKHHPTYLVSCREDLFAEHRKYADVFAFDPYGSDKSPYGAVDKAVRWLRTATVATEGRQPLVVVPWSCSPEPGSLRAIAYASLAHDARGIIWYPWSQAGGGPVGIGLRNDPKSQAEHRKLCAEVNVMLPGLLSTTRRPFEEGAVHGMAFGAEANKRFLILVNTTNETVNADFAVPELAKVKQARLPFEPKVEKRDAQGKAVVDKQGSAVLEEQPVAIADGRVQHRFKPYETRVYRW